MPIFEGVFIFLTEDSGKQNLHKNLEALFKRALRSTLDNSVKKRFLKLKKEEKKKQKKKKERGKEDGPLVTNHMPKDNMAEQTSMQTLSTTNQKSTGVKSKTGYFITDISNVLESIQF